MAYIGAEPVPGQNREVDDISSGFNGNATAFTLQVSSVNVSPESANNILINLGGVLQNPGTDYTIAASTITFTTAPAAGLSFFGLILGAGINTATVADGTIGTAKVVDNSITADKLAHTSVTAGSYTTADITVDAQGRITAAASGTISGAEIADQAVTNAKVNNSAAIAGTKISPDFGSQNIVTTGDANINGGDLTVTGGEGVSAVLKLVADQGDDNGDGWRLISNQDDNDLTISNNISGSYADKLTLKNNGDLHILDKIIHDGDTNTAIRFPSADTVTVETAGSERVRVDSSGNVGLGVTSISNARFRIKGANNNTSGFNDGLMVTSNNETVYKKYSWAGIETNGGLSFHEASSGSVVETMRITTSGSVGIGTTSPGQKLSIAGASGQDSYFETNTLVNGGLVLNVNGTQRGIFANDSAFGTAATTDIGIGAKGDMIFRTGTSGYTERMRVNSAGRIMMDTTAVRNNSTLTVKGNGVAPISCEASATTGFSQIFFVNPNGNCGQVNTSGTSTSYLTSSDYRLKENIIDLTGAITRIKTLQPKRFNWISDETNTLQDGFLAHEITAVPEATTGTKDEVDSDNNPVYQMIDNSKLVPLLTAALKEAVTKIETLETKVAALEAA